MPERPVAGVAPTAAPEAPRGSPARIGRHLAVRLPTLVVGVLVALALLGVGSFAVANVLVRTTERDSSTLRGDVRRVEVHVTGSVHVTGGGPGRAEVARRSSFGLTRPQVDVTLVDGLLTVRVECRGSVTVVCDNRVDLEVPAAASLSIHALSAHVTDVDGDVEVDSDAGSVTLTRLTGTVDADVGGGAVTGRDLRSDEVRARAGAGSVDLEFAVAPHEVVADSGAGSVVVTVPRGEEAYRVEMTSGAGEQVSRVRTDAASDRLVRATTGAGSVEVRYP